MNKKVCPTCKEESLLFCKEEPQTFNEPGYHATFFCNTCGAEFDALFSAKDVVFAISGERPDTEMQARAMLSHWAFKYTDSGVYLGFHEFHGIHIVPYTEGFDGEHESIFLEYPFLYVEYDDSLKEADRIGSETWKCIHEHDEDCECYLYI